MKVSAPAKINPFLSVGARRPDGLHEICSVMQSVSLYDTLAMTASDSIIFDVWPPGSAPEDESNLVIRAVRALWAGSGVAPGAAIVLAKEIPAAAGLGGGSSDAAAALVGLNELWSLGLSRKALSKMGAALGADVPFCVSGGTAVARGAGEVLSPLAVASPVWWVLALPSASLATAAVYAEFDTVSAPSLEDPFDVADALARGDLARLAGSLRNDLEPAALSLMPELGSCYATLMDAGALGAVMSGSGPAWCALARDEDDARDIASRVSSRFSRAFPVSSLDRGPRIVER